MSKSKVFLPLALAVGVFSSDAFPDVPSGTSWIDVEYRRIVDERAITNSGEPVGVVLDRIAAAGDRFAPPPADDHDVKLLHPHLEPFAFVLADALDAATQRVERGWMDIGALWPPGSKQPAWAEMLRSRRYFLESDGRGNIRAFLPFEGGEAEVAGRSAWNAAASVVGLALDAERRRLGKNDSSLEVAVYPFKHDMRRTRFRLGLEPYRFEYSGFGQSAAAEDKSDVRTFDLGEWRRFVEEGLQLEGARLEKDGRIVLLGSRRAKEPTILGRPIDLSDFAVAYRAIFHGGPGEPFMSLDRGVAPHTTRVNYGGRLRDTALGLVSLLCDIRFKTFSQGIDPVTGLDLRKEMEKIAPGFLTHIERFAADPRAVGISVQQTRLWFYPDTVELTVSDDGSVLAMRSVRMAAAAERVDDGSSQGADRTSPPWTKTTVESIDGSYDALTRIFPELGDLDHVVRLLSLFSWLKQIGSEGLPVPNLDALLDIELPAVSTPRTFPYLLSLIALPDPGKTTGTDVVQRSVVVDALDRLLPVSGRPLPARERLARLFAGLSGRRSAHTRRLQEAAKLDLESMSDHEIDMLAYQLERSRMHSLVMTTLGREEKERLRERDRLENLRVFSIGTGGLDLDMSKSLRRASRSTKGLSLGRARKGDPASASRGRGEATRRPAGSQGRIMRAALARPRVKYPLPAAAPAWIAAAMPSHGIIGRVQGHAGSVQQSEGEFASGDGGASAPAIRWSETVYNRFGLRPSSRRVLMDDSGRLLEVRRLIDGRFLSYQPKWTGREMSMVETEGPVFPSKTQAIGGLEDSQAALEIVPRKVDTSNALEGAAVVVYRGGRSERLVPPVATMQRLVLGPALDTLSAQPLRGLERLPEILSGSRHLFVMASEDFSRPPWDRRSVNVSGSEDSLEIARALRNWWKRPGSKYADSPDVVHAVSADAVARWRRADLRLRGKAQMLIPEGAFPEHRRALLAKIRAAWSGTQSDKLPRRVSDLILVVSAESPESLGRRLLEIAADPRMKGKYLAVWSFGGEVRRDLIGRVLAEGGVAALGTATSALIDLAADIDAIAALSRDLADTAKTEKRPEEMDGPLIWHY